MPPAETSAALAAADRLRRLAGALAVGAAPDATDATWAADRLMHYLEAASAGVRLDAAFGLRTCPGETPWWRAEIFAERDQLLRLLGDTLEGRTSDKATEVRRRLRHYAATAWLRDRFAKQPTRVNVPLFDIFSRNYPVDKPNRAG